MIVYKCIITGDEFFNDSFDFKDEGGFYVLKGKFVTKKTDDIDDSALGGNPSAEEASEGTEGGTESGIDIVMASRLVETGFGTKKEYQVYMKDYTKLLFKALEGTKSAEELVEIKAGYQEAYKAACGRFKEYQFFVGETMSPEGLTALIDWKDEVVDGSTVNVPYFYVYKAGVVADKY